MPLVHAADDFGHVDGLDAHAFLGVAGQNSGQIDRAGALGAVEAPDGFRSVGIHIHRFRSVAPARCHGEGDADIGEFEFFRAIRSLPDSADAGIRDDALHGGSIRIAEFRGEQLRHGPGLGQGALFGRLADAAEATIDGGTNADFWIVVFFHEKCGLRISCDGIVAPS